MEFDDATLIAYATRELKDLRQVERIDAELKTNAELQERVKRLRKLSSAVHSGMTTTPHPRGLRGHAQRVKPEDESKPVSELTPSQREARLQRLAGTAPTLRRNSRTNTSAVVGAFSAILIVMALYFIMKILESSEFAGFTQGGTIEVETIDTLPETSLEKAVRESQASIAADEAEAERMLEQLRAEAGSVLGAEMEDPKPAATERTPPELRLLDLSPSEGTAETEDPGNAEAAPGSE